MASQVFLKSHWRLLLAITLIGLFCMFGSGLIFFIRRFIAQRLYMFGVHTVRKNQENIGVDSLEMHISDYPDDNSYHHIISYGFERIYYESQALKTITRKPVYLLILVSTSPHDSKHRLLRQAIRDTWANCENLPKYKSEYESAVLRERGDIKNINCTVLFYFGRSSKEQDVVNKEEADQYQDIIIGDFKDSYFNMTRKVLFAMNYASNKFRPKFILKTDDDIFMNVPRLINLLHTKYKSVTSLYGGYLYFTYVNRDPSHRHYLSRDQLREDWYPPYCKGAQLIISGHLLQPLLRVAKRTPRFQIDDAYIGILMRSLLVIPTYVDEFVQNQWMPYVVDLISLCSMQTIVGVGDSLKPENIQTLHSMAHADTSPLYCIHVGSIFMLCFGGLVLFSVIIFKWVALKRLFLQLLFRLQSGIANIQKRL